MVRHKRLSFKRHSAPRGSRGFHQVMMLMLIESMNFCESNHSSKYPNKTPVATTTTSFSPCTFTLNRHANGNAHMNYSYSGCQIKVQWTPEEHLTRWHACVVCKQALLNITLRDSPTAVQAMHVSTVPSLQHYSVESPLLRWYINHWHSHSFMEVDWTKTRGSLDTSLKQ